MNAATKPLTDDEGDLLALLNAAGIYGITVDGILTQAAGVEVQLTRDAVLAGLRAFHRRGLAEPRSERWYVTRKGRAVVNSQ
jgi:hypothetical protein